MPLYLAKPLISLLFVVTIAVVPLWAQKKKDTSREDIVQFTGLVVSGDSLYGIAGARLYVEGTRRGTTTNPYGYFSMPVLKSDTVTIRSMGFKKREFYIGGDSAGKELSVVLEMEPDTTMLDPVNVYAYPTEEEFKKAFLALELPKQDVEHMKQNLNEQVMNRMLYHSDMSASMNHTYAMQQHVENIESRQMGPTISLLNPFAWARFIKSVKEGDLKQKSWKKD